MSILICEALRFAITSAPSLFEFLENNSEGLVAADDLINQKLSFLLYEVKRKSEQNLVTCAINFGKFIETILLKSGYSSRTATLLGVVKQIQVSCHLGFCSLTTLTRIQRCYSLYSFPTRLDLSLPLCKREPENIVHKMAIIRNIGHFEMVEVNDIFIRLVLESGIRIIPSGPIFGTVTVPGSKSISNRILLMAALGEGDCVIEGLLNSDDIQVMIQSLKELGVKFKWSQDGEKLKVVGCSGKFRKPTKPLYMNNSGTSARFLTAAVTLVANNDESLGEITEGRDLQGDDKICSILTGNSRMKERPIAPLVSALKSNGSKVNYLETEGCLPISVENKKLIGGKIFLEGKVSSQYVSSILISSPYSSSPLQLQLAEQSPVSLPYILMTLQLMIDFGIAARFIPPNRFEIPNGVYSNPLQYNVEPDASSATYLLALAAITGGKIILRHLGSKSLQGDAQFHTLLESMGCKVSQSQIETTVEGPPNAQRLRAVKVNMETMTDSFMTIAVLAAVGIGQTQIRGIGNQRVKECNRIEVMIEEMTKLGISCGEFEDGLWIDGVEHFSKFKTPAYIQCHDDHRIALSFAVLGSVIPGIVITDKDCTTKTYPGFWDACRLLQLRLVPGSEPLPSIQTIISTPNQNFSPIFLVGMRGCGKTTFGHLSAVAFGFSFLCMDAVLEMKFGESILSFVKNHGWDAFRREEVGLLCRIVQNNPSNTIISCGGGIVDTTANVELLCQCQFVIHIEQPWAELKQTLLQDSTRPKLTQNVDEVWARRQVLYRKCSKYEFKTSINENSTQNFIQFLQQMKREMSNITA